MVHVCATMTVNEVLDRWPAAAAVINLYALDLCCGGSLTLRQAAAAAGADLQALLRDLERAVGGRES